MIEAYAAMLRAEGKSENTIDSYTRSVIEYCKWYENSFGSKLEKLLASNVSDYISYLRTVQSIRGTSLNPKVAALKSFNKYLIEAGTQSDMVVYDKHRDKLQALGISPNTLEQEEVDAFRQKVLLNNGTRDHAIVTILAYAGLRISEALELKLDEDVDLPGRMLTVHGKGNKVRQVIMSPKVVNAIQEYLKERCSDSPYLFVSRQSEKLHRSVVNKMFKKHSDTMEPHKLRHFFCEHALECGFTIPQVAYMAGHSNVRTTTGYLSASRKEMMAMADRL